MNVLLRAFKQALTLVGARLSRRHASKLQGMLNYVLLGRWMRDRGFHFDRRVTRREDVWASVATQVAERKVLFLEFGVYLGDSMRYWSRTLKHPESRLHGFDSFVGLPKDAGPWTGGQFDAGGIIPVIDDPRVTFFKGWFDEVLPTYAVPAHDVLVLNMDADLYASTICVLRHFRPYIKKGTFIYFDEINQFAHECRAFDEFMNETGLTFRPVCADKTLSLVFFECTG